MENNKNKKYVKFQGDMLNLCDFIQVFVFTTNHHLKEAKSFGEQFLSLKDRKTAILNAQTIRMLQTHVSTDIYSKYCLIHNTSPLQGKERFMK